MTTTMNYDDEENSDIDDEENNVFTYDDAYCEVVVDDNDDGYNDDNDYAGILADYRATNQPAQPPLHVQLDAENQRSDNLRRAIMAHRKGLIRTTN